jgi:thymidylate synthase (FAD)
MNVNLVSFTKSSLSELDLNPEELIVYIARVSNPANQLSSETAPKLISYLIKNKHWSPFEMVDMTVEIVTSRAIAQQILRHRSFSFQEFSQRYAIVAEMESIQLREQAEKNRQSSTKEFDPMIPHGQDAFQDRASLRIDRHLRGSEKLYQELIGAGVAKECARMVLPLTTQTRIYMKGSVRSWIHYLQIRCDEHTQLEHRQIALEIKDIFETQFPNISEALWQTQ